MMHYGIKRGYREQNATGDKPIPFRDSRRRSRRSQSEVYRLSRDLAVLHNLDSLVDLGCGLGFKLAEFMRPICGAITGIDCPEAIEYCKRHHRFGRWVTDDIECPCYVDDRPCDLIIAADVIEHLRNPDLVLEYIRRLAHSRTWIVVSTPERDRVRGRESLGPPENQFHVREWNSDVNVKAAIIQPKACTKLVMYMLVPGAVAARHL